MKKITSSIYLGVISIMLMLISSCVSDDTFSPKEQKINLIKDSIDFSDIEKIKKLLDIENFNTLTLAEKTAIVNTVDKDPEKYGFILHNNDELNKNQHNTEKSPEATLARSVLKKTNNIKIYTREGHFITIRKDASLKSINENYHYYFDGQHNISSGYIYDSQACGTVHDACSSYYGLNIDVVPRSHGAGGGGQTDHGDFILAYKEMWADREGCGDMPAAEEADPVGGVIRLR